MQIISFRRRFKIHPSTEGSEKLPIKSRGEEIITLKILAQTFIRYLTFLILFPLTPVFLFIRILWKIDGEDFEEDLSRKLSLKLANEVSIIYITIESSLQTILTLWLILRGIIRQKHINIPIYNC